MQERRRPADVIQAVEIDQRGVDEEIRVLRRQRPRAHQSVLLGVGEDDTNRGGGWQLIEGHEHGDQRGRVIDSSRGIVIHPIQHPARGHDHDKKEECPPRRVGENRRNPERKKCNQHGHDT